MNKNTIILDLNGMLRVGLIGLIVLVQTACGVFSDDPATQALQHIRGLVAMSEQDYQLKRKDIALREQASIDYLRAMRIQNTKLSFDIEDIRRPEAKQREVIVSVSEKRGAGGSHERARFRIRVEQNADGIWQVASFQLVE